LILYLLYYDCKPFRYKDYMTNIDSSIALLGFIHLLSSIILALIGSDSVLVISQFVIGIFELFLAIYFYQENRA